MDYCKPLARRCARRGRLASQLTIALQRFVFMYVNKGDTQQEAARGPIRSEAPADRPFWKTVTQS